MSDFRKYLNEQLEHPAFAAEYEAMRPEYEAIRSMIAARAETSMAQTGQPEVRESVSGTR